MEPLSSVFAGTLAIFGLGTPELIVILVILLVLFGGAKLPGLAKGLGQSIKEFKKASKEEDSAGEANKPDAKKDSGSSS